MAAHNNYSVTVKGNASIGQVQAAFDDLLYGDFTVSREHDAACFKLNGSWNRMVDDIAALTEENPGWDIEVIVYAENGRHFHARAKGGRVVTKAAVIVFPPISDEELEVK